MSADGSNREKAGDVLGDYTLERPLNEGAMGRVWLGRHVKLGRNAAIKVFKAEHTQNSERVGRFFHEARAVNQLNHEHIVAISDFVEELSPPRVYCVMEYLPGQSLERRLAEAPLPISEVLSVVRQICDALAAAHRLGIVHRDLKPSNIFLTTKVDGSLFVKVLDFGVARLGLLGTPAYEVDGKADIYALGTMLYQLLAGNPPLAHDDIGKGSVPPLPERAVDGASIDRRIAKAVMRCLAKNPKARPGADELSAVLLLAQRGESAPPQSGRGMLAAMVAALIAVTAFAGWLWLRATPPPASPPAQVAKTVKLTVRTEPPGARVTDVASGVALGTTPLVRELPRGRPLQLKLSLDGYHEVERGTTADSDVVLDVVLAAPLTVPPPPESPPPSVRPARKPKNARQR